VACLGDAQHTLIPRRAPDFYGFIISFSDQHLLSMVRKFRVGIPLANSGQTLSPSGPPLGLSFGRFPDLRMRGRYRRPPMTLANMRETGVCSGPIGKASMVPSAFVLFG
jgi:hypothetical protein